MVYSHINSSLKRLIYNCIEQVLYLGQIIYDFGFLPKVSAKTSKTSQSNSSANCVNLHTAKSHKYIVWVFYMLNVNIDSKAMDKLTSLKKTIAQYDWPK